MMHLNHMDLDTLDFLKKKYNDVIKSCPNKIELVIFGHTFLSDKEGNKVV